MVRQNKKSIPKKPRAIHASPVRTSSLLYSDFFIHPASDAELPLWRSLAGQLFPNSSIELGADDVLLLAFAPTSSKAGAAPPPPIIGFVHLHPQPSAILLCGISVIPSWRGRGVGRALMEAAMQKAQEEWPALPFQLEVEQTNPAALRLYASWGFALVKTGPTTYRLARQASN